MTETELSEGVIERFNLRDLKATAKTQTREELNPEALAEYKAHIKLAISKGADPEFGPLKAYRNPLGGDTWLSDGFHRRAALLANDIEAYDVEIIDSEDPRRDAIKNGFKANVSHGVRRTNADKLHNLFLALEDKEWALLPNTGLADLISVSEAFVRANRPVSKTPTKVKTKRGVELNTSNLGNREVVGNQRNKKRAAAKAAKKSGKNGKNGKNAPSADEAPKTDTALTAAYTKIANAIDGHGFKGQETIDAIKDGTIQMSASEVKKLAQNSADKIRLLSPLVLTSRWSVGKAISFLDKVPSADTKAADFINLALANGGIVRERVESAGCIWYIADDYTVGEGKDGVITITPKKKKK
jgi:hypothetical protein